MSNNDEEIKKDIEKLLDLLDVKPSKPEETAIFKEASHKELCNVVEYWIDQCKLIFGKVVWLQQNQSLRDSGVDVVCDFPRTNLKVGFQIKSYGDIEDGNFTRNTKSQIQDSRKHNLRNLIVMFAADLTDKSQAEKTRGLISELHQGDSYAITFPPEKLATMLIAYREKKHPFELAVRPTLVAMMDFITKTYSTKGYKVDVNVSIKPDSETGTGESPIRAELTAKFDQTTWGTTPWEEIMGRTARGETVKLTKEIVKAQVFFAGKPLVPEGYQPTEIAIELPKVELPVGRLETVGSDGRVLGKLENIIFARESIVDNTLTMVSKDDLSPMRIKIIYDIGTQQADVTIGYEVIGCDVVTVFNAEKFLESIKNAELVRLVNSADNNTIFEAKGRMDIPEVDKRWLMIIEALAKIQTKTGYRIVIPDVITAREAADILDIAEGLDMGFKEVNSLRIKISVDKASAQSLIDQYLKDSVIKDFKIRQQVKATVFGQQIPIGEAIFENVLFRPKSDINQLQAAIKEMRPEDKISIELETIENTRPRARLLK